MRKFADRFDQLKGPPIFVVGAARSGTTWLLDIFNAHPLVATFHESWLFTQKDGLASLFSEVHSPMRQQGIGRYMTMDEIANQARDTAKSILGRVILPEHRFFVEKSPSHVYSTKIIKLIFPSAKIVHVLRDGRDVAVSVRSASRSWAPQWKSGFAKSISQSAVAWKDVCEHAKKVGDELGNDFLEVRYEQLHKDPVVMYRTIFDFAEIPYTDEILERIHKATDFRLNFAGGENNFRRAGRIGDWRRNFSIFDAIAFNIKAGDMLVRLNFEKNRFWLPDFRKK